MKKIITTLLTSSFLCASPVAYAQENVDEKKAEASQETRVRSETYTPPNRKYPLTEEAFTKYLVKQKTMTPEHAEKLYKMHKELTDKIPDTDFYTGFTPQQQKELSKVKQLSLLNYYLNFIPDSWMEPLLRTVFYTSEWQISESKIRSLIGYQYPNKCDAECKQFMKAMKEWDGVEIIDPIEYLHGGYDDSYLAPYREACVKNMNENRYTNRDFSNKTQIHKSLLIKGKSSIGYYERFNLIGPAKVYSFPISAKKDAKIISFPYVETGFDYELHISPTNEFDYVYEPEGFWAKKAMQLNPPKINFLKHQQARYSLLINEVGCLEDFGSLVPIKGSSFSYYRGEGEFSVFLKYKGTVWHVNGDYSNLGKSTWEIFINKMKTHSLVEENYGTLIKFTPKYIFELSQDVPWLE